MSTAKFTNFQIFFGPIFLKNPPRARFWANLRVWAAGSLGNLPTKYRCTAGNGTVPNSVVGHFGHKRPGFGGASNRKKLGLEKSPTIVWTVINTNYLVAYDTQFDIIRCLSNATVDEVYFGRREFDT